MRVTIDPTRGVEVVLPRRAPEREAAAAIRELRPWIERRVAELEDARAAVAARGDTVPYLGQTLALSGEAGTARAYPSRRRAARARTGTSARRRWRAGTAARPGRDRAAPERACALAGTSYTGLTIRGQRTRWASCSRTGAMSFNWRLLLAPEAVLDYVVWHEVCHLEVMDHSPRFWRLLATRDPGYREHLRWLRANGATLAL